MGDITGTILDLFKEYYIWLEKNNLSDTYENYYYYYTYIKKINLYSDSSLND